MAVGKQKSALRFLRQGITDGPRWKLYAGLALLGWSALRKATARSEDVVYSEKLAPGHAVTVSHLPLARKDERRGRGK